jgi:hypothetical protein
MAVSAHGAEPVGEMPQLMQLNRASQQELRVIQSKPPSTGISGAVAGEGGAKQLNRKQRLEQRELQEQQRRRLLMEKQRAKTVNQSPQSRRLDAIGRQSQFRQQQQNQLNRFRIQQGTLGR